MVRECDTLLMVAFNLPYAEFLPSIEQARSVQIDIEPKNLALGYPMEVPPGWRRGRNPGGFAAPAVAGVA